MTEKEERRKSRIEELQAEISALKTGLKSSKSEYERLYSENEGRISQMAEWAIEMHTMRKALKKIANGATGHLDRDSTLADWASEALKACEE